MNGRDLFSCAGLAFVLVAAAAFDTRTLVWLVIGYAIGRGVTLLVMARWASRRIRDCERRAFVEIDSRTRVPASQRRVSSATRTGLYPSGSPHHSDAA